MSLILVNYSQAEMRKLRESCESSEECASGRCAKNECASVRCRSNRDCLRAGHDHYCRDRGLKIIASECVPKKGKNSYLEILDVEKSFGT